MSNLRLFVVPLLFALLLFGCIDLRSKETRFCDSMMPIIAKEFGVEARRYIKSGDDPLEQIALALGRQDGSISEMYSCRYYTYRVVGEYPNSLGPEYDLDEVQINYVQYAGDNAQQLTQDYLDAGQHLAGSVPHIQGQYGDDFVYSKYTSFDRYRYSFILISGDRIVEVFYNPESKNYTLSKPVMETVARQAMSIAKELE